MNWRFGHKPSGSVPRVEKKIDLLLKHLGISTEAAGVSPAPDPIRELTRAGRKIEAIKLYRERTGAGLKEAKDAVDATETGAGIGLEQKVDHLLAHFGLEFEG
ncbi:MAG: ribosomal protein L7/L12 [Armatimonadetes bacterium]|nr:ribosomal protein L7/L12 [Armatimonadota bacterium]